MHTSQVSDFTHITQLFLSPCTVSSASLSISVQHSQLERTSKHAQLSYSGKFSRGPIFAVFADDCQTPKTKPAK